MITYEIRGKKQHCYCHTIRLGKIHLKLVSADAIFRQWSYLANSGGVIMKGNLMHSFHLAHTFH